MLNSFFWEWGFTYFYSIFPFFKISTFSSYLNFIFIFLHFFLLFHHLLRLHRHHLLLQIMILLLFSSFINNSVNPSFHPFFILILFLSLSYFVSLSRHLSTRLIFPDAVVQQVNIEFSFLYFLLNKDKRACACVQPHRYK